MTSSDMQALDKQYIMPTYGRANPCLVSGKGCIAVDADGKEYLDFTAGIGVNSLGWCDDEWQQAVAKQAATLQHTSNYFCTPPMLELAQVLCQKTGMDKVFFSGSGAEANECAIKAARKYSFSKYGKGRHNIITLENSFHGRTMATITATGQDSFHQYFDPFLPGFMYVKPNDMLAMNEALNGTVCAVMVEVIQGESGVHPLQKEYLQQLAAVCQEQDVLLITDEVQCGVGRTGTFLGYEQADIKPDIVTVAKGLGAGLPIGATLFNKKVAASSLQKGDHGSTFGGNPVSCAGALVVMNRLNDDFLAQVAQKGELIKQALLNMPQVASVHGYGLMLGIELKGNMQALDVLQKASDNGLLCLVAKDRLRLLPPLTITQKEIEKGLVILQQTLKECE